MAAAFGPLPPPATTPAVRVQEIRPDGSRVDQLRTGDGRCIQLVRTLRKALMGKVKAAVACALGPDGRWTPHPGSTQVAVKQIYKWCIAQGTTLDGRRVQEDPRLEMSLMQLLSVPGHGNVLRLIALLEDNDCLYMVLEYLDGGELFDQVHHRGRVPESEARGYIWQVLQGTKYLHSRGWCHRDISLENAMISNAPTAGVVKVIDFGLSMALPPVAGALLPPNGRVGKEKYMAPEIFAQQFYSGTAVDMWTLGMCIFVLLFGIYPYQVASAAHCRYFAEIAAGRLLSLMRGWGYQAIASDSALDLISGLLCVDPARRLSVAEAEAHPWFAPLAAAASAAASAPDSGPSGSQGGSPSADAASSSGSAPPAAMTDALP